MFVDMEDRQFLEGFEAPGRVQIGIHRLPHAPEDLPQYKTSGSVGMDLQAAIEEPLTLGPLERALVPTGWKIALPEGYEAQVRARSGLAIKHGIGLSNGIGTIDWDYRDEVKVALINVSNEAYTIQPGDRIAQLVIVPVTLGQWVELSESELADSGPNRGGGFGSTGR
jgi:dUTP pyrophosphatase